MKLPAVGVPGASPCFVQCLEMAALFIPGKCRNLWEMRGFVGNNKAVMVAGIASFDSVCTIGECVVDKLQPKRLLVCVCSLNPEFKHSSLWKTRDAGHYH